MKKTKEYWEAKHPKIPKIYLGRPLPGTAQQASMDIRHFVWDEDVQVDALIRAQGWNNMDFSVAVQAAQVDIGTTNATFAVAADDTNEALLLTVTCSSGDVKCVARVQLTQVDY